MSTEAERSSETVAADKGSVGNNPRQLGLMAIALIAAWLYPTDASMAQTSDCYSYGEAGSQLMELRQRLSSGSPDELDEWVDITDQYQARAAMLAAAPNFDKAALYQLEQVHLLKLATGNYRLIYAANSMVCGFAQARFARPEIAEKMLKAAAVVRETQRQEPTPEQYPGSPEFEALYQFTMSAQPAMPDYPHDECVAFDPQQGFEPQEPLQKSTFNGEPVVYLSHRSMANPAEGLLFHIFGPNKYKAFVWLDGIMLRERGDITDLILIANYNACGFDGRVSFPTSQIQKWLNTRPDNQVTLEPGDPTAMNPQERRDLQRFMDNPPLSIGKP
ncbi:hypothetical protein [Mesorhizobium sp. ES1-4]|uniref:hypothetical protein n=1 Tax=Mesorhizobium sp. ES1-4 TaxID=2876627 RepID=UPI001CCA4BFD|nr:hypothetical protein [Mesorhizobium sp. ES1-4]MBZ9795587.1 hypothetical protein [Mesorhizobium sp. ES1-4]